MSGIVLCGCGIYGAMLLGAIHERVEIQNVRLIAGTSAGAIIGALLAIGYTPLEILAHIEQHLPLISLDTIDLNQLLTRFGLFSSRKMFDFVDQLIIDKCNKIPTFEEVYEMYGVCLIVTGTNVSKQKSMYFDKYSSPNMCINIALQISSCIPIIFPYVLHENNICIDGGICDNLPLKYAKDFANKHTKITCIDAFDIQYDHPIEIHSIFDYILNMFKLFVNKWICTDDNVHIIKTMKTYWLTTSNVNDVREMFEDGRNIFKNQ